MKVRNMTSNRSGREVANQFIISTDNDGAYFQSYNTVIAHNFIDDNGNRQIVLDPNWDYSHTTGKYRNQFLGETKKETEAKIKSGEYKIADLNK